MGASAVERIGEDGEKHQNPAERWEVAAQAIQAQSTQPLNKVEEFKLNCPTASDVREKLEEEGINPFSLASTVESFSGKLLDLKVDSKGDSSDVDQRKYSGPEVKYFDSSDQKIVDDDAKFKDTRNLAPENVTASPSGNSVAAGMATPAVEQKGEVPLADQRQGRDSSEMEDSDGDGIPKYLDKMDKTKAQIATEMMRNVELKAKLKKGLRRSALVRAFIRQCTSVLDAINSAQGKKEKKGPGDIDIFGKKDKEDRISAPGESSAM